MSIDGLFQKGQREENNNNPLDARTAEGVPLYHALMEASESGVADHYAAEDAKDRLYAIFDYDPNTIRLCEGKSLEEVRSLLETVEEAMGFKQAA
jgi:heat shock protein HspQ